jgi:K+-sensing histidine kinase KdpD
MTLLVNATRSAHEYPRQEDGRFRVYLGAAVGVGKTDALLDES